MVGDKGKIYSIDILKDMLQKIKNEAIRSHITNIETLWGNIEKLGGTRLADSSVDAVLVCNTMFQLEDKDHLPFEAKRILKSGGRILVVDWKESYGGMGPQAHHVFSPEMAKSVFEKAGFIFEREIKAGAHHYGIIFKRG
jgi:ubiquinone/menaquinone biosynthesis C-methylase UbiE